MSNNVNSFNLLSDNDLAKLVKDGNNTAFEELSFRYLGIINHIARKFSVEGYEHNDFVQEGLLGLLFSCRTFDCNSPATFKSYMSLIVERRFISIIRKSNAQKIIPASNIVNIDEFGDAFEDFTQNPEEIMLCKEYYKSLINKLKSMLSKSEFDVLMLYSQGLSYKQISQKLSISEKSADNALSRARKKIRFRNMSS